LFPSFSSVKSNADFYTKQTKETKDFALRPGREYHEVVRCLCDLL
jgi:hypothetical protein